MRPHLSINVTDVKKSVEFYTQLFGIKPQKMTEKYAKFDLKTPHLNFSMQADDAKGLSKVNHLGIELDFPEELSLWQSRLEKAGIPIKPEMNTDCCYAKQDKIWFSDPDNNHWEIFYVYEQLAVPQQNSLEAQKKVCCAPSQNQNGCK